MTLEEACNTYYDRVYHYALRKLFFNTYAAEVATQNTFVALTSHWDDLDHDRIEPWLMKTAKNYVLKMKAEHTKRNAALADFFDDTQVEDPDSDVFRQMLNRRLEPKIEDCIGEVMAQLSDRDKLILRYLRKELKLKEVAEELGVSSAAVCTASVRVHKRVREIVDKVIEKNEL